MISKKFKSRRDRDWYYMAEAMDITGWTSQCLSKKARRKQIDGAYQPGGKRGDWRFKKKPFDAWWAEQSRPEK